MVVFGNDFSNKAVVLPQTLVIPIDLAEEVSALYQSHSVLLNLKNLYSI